MKLSLLLLVLLIAILAVEGREISRASGEEAPLGELLQVQFIFRHGDRTPYWFYKNDRYQEPDFWEGEGNLINRGKERMYRFGKVLRKRYSDYISKLCLWAILLLSLSI